MLDCNFASFLEVETTKWIKICHQYQLYGIIIYMYFMDNKQHKLPHIHAKYQDDEAVVSIPDGEVLGGDIPKSKMKLLQAWIEIHKEELVADWQLAVDGEKPYKIDPLR